MQTETITGTATQEQVTGQTWTVHLYDGEPHPDSEEHYVPHGGDFAERADAEAFLQTPDEFGDAVTFEDYGDGSGGCDVVVDGGVIGWIEYGAFAD